MKPARFLLRLAAAGLAFTITVSALADVPVAVAQKLMQQSGGLALLGQVSPAVQTYLLAAVQSDAAGDTAKREHLLPLSQSLQKAYAPERLRADAVQTVARQLSPEDARALQAWFDSPLGQQVVAVEAQLTEGTDDPGQKLQGAMQTWRQLSPQRQALLTAVVNGTHAASLQAEVLIQSLQAIHRGAAGFSAKAAKVSAKDMKARLEAQREELTASYQSAAQALAGSFYAPLSDEQLADYGAFLASPLGERLQSVQTQAIVKAVRSASDEASRSIAVGATATPAGVPREGKLLEQLNRGPASALGTPALGTPER